MPLPKPESNETPKQFLDRCMGDPMMLSEYPDNTRRAAVCHRLNAGHSEPQAHVYAEVSNATAADANNAVYEQIRAAAAHRPLTKKSFRTTSKATEELARAVAENLSGVEQKWLAPVVPIFQDLLTKAQDTTMSDASLVAYVQQLQAEIPELFDLLNTSDLVEAMEAAMGAAMVNGASDGIDKAEAVMQNPPK
jgi:hypothetical protein